MAKLTEDYVRDTLAKKILGFDIIENDVEQGTGQITTFNQLGFKGIMDKPDGWYLPKNVEDVAIILEVKAEGSDLKNAKHVNEIKKNCEIVLKKYKRVVGILYNGVNSKVYLNNIEKDNIINELQQKKFYLRLFDVNEIDKKLIYNLTKKINDSLHIDFGIKNFYHRMIFTACALVAQRYGATLEYVKDMGYSTFHTAIHSTLSKSLTKDKKQNHKLDILLEVYSEIKMNSNENQDAINTFIDNIIKISNCINSDFWRGEDVMGIFFNEFNRYKKKSDAGQVFTPDHITSLMYRLIDVHKDDYVLDGACGSGAFLVKSMCNMINEAGGVNTKKASEIKSSQLYGIEFDREIYALACANMMIHKDGKTNLEQLDTRTIEAGTWIKEKTTGHATKVLMNPPFERKYGCLKIVKNILDNVPALTKCAFILPDKKLEKDNSKEILKNHRLEKIIKLPEKTFNEGITTSIFIFKSGIPQNDEEIFTCYIDDDGLETVKNQGRQDTKNKWQTIENRWVEIIRKQNGHETCKWIKPFEFLSYQIEKKEFSISEEDFRRTILNYLLYEKDIEINSFKEKIVNSILYNSEITKNEENNKINIEILGNHKNED